MNNLSLYRKYRPKKFRDVVGQDTVVKTLSNQIKNGDISHAYMFSGPRGTGKTTVSKIFAAAVNCRNPDPDGSPCWKCESCNPFNDSNSINPDIIEIDAASNNGVDNVRELIDQSRYVPQNGSFKVYIIDEVHMLSTSAFNALLKTLEEPNSSTLFILATTELNKVPATVLSRCQRYTFSFISDIQIKERILDIFDKENIQATSSAALHMAGLAKGSLRDALSIADQCIAYANGNEITQEMVKEIFGDISDVTTISLVKAIDTRDIFKVLDITTEQRLSGKTYHSICTELYEYYKEEYLHNADADIDSCQRMMSILAELSERMKATDNSSIFEIEMFKLCNPRSTQDYESMGQRIKDIEDVLDMLKNGMTREAVDKPLPKEDNIIGHQSQTLPIFRILEAVL